MKKIFIIILIVILFGFTLFLSKFVISKYDHHINSNKTSKVFIDNLNENKLNDIYLMFNESYKENVSKDSLRVLLDPVFISNKKIETKISKIYSNDIFTIKIISDLKTLTFTFGDGWGKGWKIKYIQIE